MGTFTSRSRRGDFVLGMFLLSIAIVMTGCLGLSGSTGTSLRVVTTVAGIQISGAAVFIDDVDTGAKTPHVFTSLEPGVYNIRLVRMGFPEVETRAVVTEGHQTILRQDLAKGNGRIEGYVTDSRGGTGVSGVRVETSCSYTVTDRAGHYELYAPIGVHDIVATYPERSVGVAQGVAVTAEATATANIIQPRTFRSDELVARLELNISGIEPGDELTQPVRVRITVSGPHFINQLVARIGHQDPLETDYRTDTGTLTLMLDPTKLGPGPNYLSVIAYDIEYNSVQAVVPFTVARSPQVSQGMATPVPTLVAYTTSQSVGYSAVSGPTAGYTFGPADSPAAQVYQPSHFVSIEWDPVLGADGYRIERRIGETGAFRFVANVSGRRTSYLDPDPLLRPGPNIYYRMAAYDADGRESVMSAPVRVFLLEPLSVYLVSPRNQSVQTAGWMEFRWQATELPRRWEGPYEYTYDFRLQKTTDDKASNFMRYVNTYSARHPVAACSQYEWDLVVAKATLVIGDRAMAISASGRDRNSGASLNGGYTFSTACR